MSYRGTPEYNTWLGMKQRCNYSKHVSFHRYGGRGIKVCDKWNNSFTNFLNDMGIKPTPSHSLDRIDNDGDYSPENCRWASIEEQKEGRPDIKLIEYRGEVKTMVEWARELGINYTTLKQRLSIYKWTTEKAFSVKVRQYNNERISCG